MVEHPKLDNSADFFKRQLNTNQRFTNLQMVVARYADVDKNLGSAMLVTNGYVCTVDVKSVNIVVEVGPDVYGYSDDRDLGGVYHSFPTVVNKRSKLVSRFRKVSEHSDMFAIVEDVLIGV